MIDYDMLTRELNKLPLYAYFWLKPEDLEFTERVRWVCRNECPMYGTTWACPPGVGTVAECREKCLQYQNCLAIGTVTEVEDISCLEDALKTRGDHEAVTARVQALLRSCGAEPYILSTEACALCRECTYGKGKPCRHPEQMHPCVESHGINLIPILEENGLDFQFGGDAVTWYSLLFY